MTRELARDVVPRLVDSTPRAGRVEHSPPPITAIQPPPLVAAVGSVNPQETPLPSRVPEIKSGATRAAASAQPSAASDKSLRTDEQERSIYVTMFEQAPSWLTSIIFHMLLIIVLGLIVLKAPRVENSIGFELGGGSGQGGFGGEFEEPLGGISESASAISTTTVDIVAATPEAPAIPILSAPSVAETNIPRRAEISETFLKGAMRGDGSFVRGAGDGLGAGDGEGTGAGSGNSGSGTGNGMASTRTQVFGLVEEARSFVYVFDRSDSMNSVLSYSSEGSNVFSITPLEAAKAELLRSLEDLTKQQRFQIVFYNNTTSLFRQSSASHHLLLGNRENKRLAIDYVNTMPGDGGTFHLPALEIAIRLRPDAIFLMTDGEEKDDPTPFELSHLRTMNRGRTRINVIHFCFTPRPGGTLEQLAKENRGKHLSFHLTRLGPGMAGADARERPVAPAHPSRKGPSMDKLMETPTDLPEPIDDEP